MDDVNPVAEQFRSLYAAGESLARDIDAHLERWPHDGGAPKRKFSPGDSFVESCRALEDRAHNWFNQFTLRVLPQTSFDRSYANLLLKRVSASIRGCRFFEEFHHPGLHGPGPTEHNVVVVQGITSVRQDAIEAWDAALRLVRTAPAPVDSIRTPSIPGVQSHIPNTAFVLMWMDRERPELVDVHEVVKEVFDEFGILALRADDIEHQDRITDVILDHIARSEFLFADLSGERPNVYYEVGYAHALGKRPILYRRAGTPLHFDLAVHNVPDYKNVTELRQLLRDRLSAMTGRLTRN